MLRQLSGLLLGQETKAIELIPFDQTAIQATSDRMAWLKSHDLYRVWMVRRNVTWQPMERTKKFVVFQKNITYLLLSLPFLLLVDKKTSQNDDTSDLTGGYYKLVRQMFIVKKWIFYYEILRHPEYNNPFCKVLIINEGTNNCWFVWLSRFYWFNSYGLIILSN